MTQYEDKVQAQREKIEQEKIDNRVTAIDCRYENGKWTKIITSYGNGKEVTLVVSDRKNDNSNEFALVVGETDSIFEFNFKIENIKLIPGSYEVQISRKNLAKFTNSKYNLDYFIALEPDSTYAD